MASSPQPKPASEGGHRARNAAIIIIVLVAGAGLVAFFYYFVYYQPYVTATGITVNDVSLARCGGLTITQVYDTTFYLVNSGPRGGFAIVALTEGTQVIGTNTYFVPAGQTVLEEIIETLNCPVDQPMWVQIQSVHP